MKNICYCSADTHSYLQQQGQPLGWPYLPITGPAVLICLKNFINHTRGRSALEAQKRHKNHRGPADKADSGKPGQRGARAVTEPARNVSSGSGGVRLASPNTANHTVI